MFLTAKPDADQIRKFLNERAGDQFSYDEVGATATAPPAGYNIDHNRVRLGRGEIAYEAARAAVRGWKMFDMPWVELLPADARLEIGTTVAILVRHFGFYSMNASRIVYLIDSPGEVEKFGFAYGTLTEHGEIGEERFSVEFHKNSGEVWYDLLAFSRPGHVLARIGYPLSRYLQKAFAEDSRRAMLNAVREGSSK